MSELTANRSFHKHVRNVETWSFWVKEYLISRFAAKMGNRIMAEGLVFYNLKRKEQNKIYRVKLRRDMYDWFYSDRIEINDDPLIPNPAKPEPN